MRRLFTPFLVGATLGSIALFACIRLAPPSRLVLAEHITYRVDPTPTLQPTNTPTPTPTLTPTSTPLPTATPKPKPTATLGPTPIPTLMPTSTSLPVITAPVDLEPLFSEYAQKYNVNVHLLKKIADCESHFNTGVVSKNGLYAGMFQFSEGTWVSNRRAMGADATVGLRHGARESIETAAYVIAHQGPGAWPECAN